MFTALFKASKPVPKFPATNPSFNRVNIIPSVTQLKTNSLPKSWISTSSPLLSQVKWKKPIVNESTLDFVDYGARVIRNLTVAKRRTSGRNCDGRITIRHRGGGAVHRYRIIDFKRSIPDVTAQVLRLEYDPNRNAPIALLSYATGEQGYQIATFGMRPGDTVITSETAPFVPGNTLPLYRFPIGTFAHSIEFVKGQGSKLCRAAGATAQIIKQHGKYSVLKLKNGEIRRFSSSCWGTVGAVAHFPKTILGKAGASRRRGIRPTVRGVAMNPVDHPHGGGQGKTSGGRPSVSPWAKGTKGTVTRDPRKINKNILINRRKARKMKQEAELRHS